MRDNALNLWRIQTSKIRMICNSEILKASSNLTDSRVEVFFYVTQNGKFVNSKNADIVFWTNLNLFLKSQKKGKITKTEAKKLYEKKNNF